MSANNECLRCSKRLGGGLRARFARWIGLDVRLCRWCIRGLDVCPKTREVGR